jgi:hypothetical protein
MCKGNRLRASQVLGLGRTSLYRHLKQDGYDEGAMNVRSRQTATKPTGAGSAFSLSIRFKRSAQRAAAQSPARI